jgi:DNA-binding winged helix-turn-helix (wHTH) protein
MQRGPQGERLALQPVQEGPFVAAQVADFRAEIGAGQVWGRDTDPALAGRSLGLNQFERHSLRVKFGVDVHIGRLRKAINRGRDSDPIRTVRGSGYSFDEMAYAGQVWGRDTDPALAGRSLGLNQFERHSLRVISAACARRSTAAATRTRSAPCAAPATPSTRCSRPGLCRAGLGPRHRPGPGRPVPRAEPVRTAQPAGQVTVDVHIGRLRKAINRGRDSDPIRTVRGSGYSFDTDPALAGRSLGLNQFERHSLRVKFGMEF